jgi:hypothetical protein
MIDPKAFLSTDPEEKENERYRAMQGSFSCPENGCYEVATEGQYDEFNRKIFWTCPAGHDGSARL